MKGTLTLLKLNLYVQTNYIESNRAASKKRRSLSACSVNTVPNKKRLTNSELSDFTKEHNINDYLELLAIAQIRKEEGKADIHKYFLSHQEKYVKGLIKRTWHMVQAPEILKQLNLTRMEELEAAAIANCLTGCNKQWLKCALELLCLNRFVRYVILVGPTYAGKTFMFKPVNKIFLKKLFENPSSDKFRWVGTDKASVILLQDYRWAKESIPWKDLLLLLGGETLKLPFPKNLFAEDIIICTDVAIFATIKAPIVYQGPYNKTDPQEDVMMRVRWSTFNFYSSIFRRK